MSELGVSEEINRLEIVKEIIKRRGMYHLSHKKATHTKIWKYMFTQLSEGIEKKNFQKDGILFLIIVRYDLIIIETIQRRTTVYKSFTLQKNDSIQKILSHLNQALAVYNLTILYPETAKRNPKLIVVEEKYVVTFAE